MAENRTTEIERPSANLARLSALLAAGHRLAEDMEDTASPEGFDLVTAMQCVMLEARRELTALTEALHERAAS